MTRLWSLLFAIIVLAFALDLLASALNHLLPFLIGGLVLLVIGGTIYYRRSRW